MSILDRWINKQVNKAIDAYKAANMFGPNFSLPGAYAIYPDSDIESLIEASFNTNIYYYSVIRTICRKFASPPRYVYMAGSKDRVSNNELTALLTKPNDFQAQDEFWESIIGYYQLAGEVFLYKNRGDIENGRVLELYVLPPQNIELIPDPEDVFGILGYHLILNGNKKYIAKQDIIHWRSWNPNFDASTREHLRGFNPLQAQRKTIQQGNDSIDAQVAMMQNGGARGVLNEESGVKMTPTQESQLRNVVDNKINSKYVKGAVAVMQGKWNYLNLGMSSVDMQLLDATDRAVHALCMANGIPTEIFFPDATHANKEQAMIYYITNTLMPLAASLDAKLNAELVPDFGGGMEVKTDFSELPELAMLNARLVDAAAKAWWKSTDEKRKMTNDEPLNTPESRLVFIPAGFMPLTDAATPIEPDLNLTRDNNDYL